MVNYLFIRGQIVLLKVLWGGFVSDRSLLIHAAYPGKRKKLTSKNRYFEPIWEVPNVLLASNIIPNQVFCTFDSRIYFSNRLQKHFNFGRSCYNFVSAPKQHYWPPIGFPPAWRTTKMEGKQNFVAPSIPRKHVTGQLSFHPRAGSFTQSTLR